MGGLKKLSLRWFSDQKLIKKWKKLQNSSSHFQVPPSRDQRNFLRFRLKNSILLAQNVENVRNFLSKLKKHPILGEKPPYWGSKIPVEILLSKSDFFCHFSIRTTAKIGKNWKFSCKTRCWGLFLPIFYPILGEKPPYWGSKNGQNWQKPPQTPKNDIFW